MSEFNELWNFIVNRSQGFSTVQEYHELEHVYNLMQGCESYLEVGTAEGNSLYVLAHALTPDAKIVCVDLCEKHTEAHRKDIIDRMNRNIAVYPGNSRNPNTLPIKNTYDCVLIDGGHDYDTVLSDAYMYGKLATKYIFFHDVCLPDVDRAFEEYCHGRPECRAYRMINSTTFGYGVLEI